MKIPILRMDKRFFFDTPAPPPHKGWTLQAFQDHCRDEMMTAGFDLARQVSCRYDPRSGKVVFWQEPDEDTNLFVVSEN